AIEYRWAEENLDLLPVLAADLVRRHVTLIVAIQSAAAPLAAKAATTTITIVFSIGADSFNLVVRSAIKLPVGNVTGTSFLYNTLAAKRLELLHELVPNGSEHDIGSAFATFLQQRVNALTFAADALFSRHRDELIALAAHHALPTMYFARE